MKVLVTGATGFVGASPVAAEAIAHVLAGGGYRKHLDEVHRRLARKRREVIARLRSIGVEPWIEPRGGFNLWCRLPGEIDSAELARAALKDDAAALAALDDTAKQLGL